MAVAEFREWFFRNLPVTTGTKADREKSYPTTTSYKGKTVSNRFLKDAKPTEGVFRKFLESIAFKLNPEDWATTSQVGLARKATDQEVNNAAVTSVPSFVQPHQLGAAGGSSLYHNMTSEVGLTPSEADVEVVVDSKQLPLLKVGDRVVIEFLLNEFHGAANTDFCDGITKVGIDSTTAVGIGFGNLDPSSNIRTIKVNTVLDVISNTKVLCNYDVLSVLYNGATTTQRNYFQINLDVVTVQQTVFLTAFDFPLNSSKFNQFSIEIKRLAS